MRRACRGRSPHSAAELGARIFKLCSEADRLVDLGLALFVDEYGILYHPQLAG